MVPFGSSNSMEGLKITRHCARALSGYTAYFWGGHAPRLGALHLFYVSFAPCFLGEERGGEGILFSGFIRLHTVPSICNAVIGEKKNIGRWNKIYYLTEREAVTINDSSNMERNIIHTVGSLRRTATSPSISHGPNIPYVQRGFFEYGQTCIANQPPSSLNAGTRYRGDSAKRGHYTTVYYSFRRSSPTLTILLWLRLCTIKRGCWWLRCDIDY